MTRAHALLVPVFALMLMLACLARFGELPNIFPL